MSTVLVAYYFGVILTSQDYPVLIGPYDTWSECASVREWLDRRGYETSPCWSLPVPQEAQLLEPLMLPEEPYGSP